MSIYSILSGSFAGKDAPRRPKTDDVRVGPCIWGMSGAPGGGSSDANAKLWHVEFPLTWRTIGFMWVING